ncbi:MAG: hypothetical protein ACTSQQ_13115, partial [Candidatus Helarchaeota archaeon]
SWENKGVIRPSETITEEYPYLKEKKDIPKKFSIVSQKHKRIFCEDLGLTWKEAARGVYLDVSHEMPEENPINSSLIISTGVGMETKFRD